jgi:heterodisulfide reductase subunit A2
VHEVRAVSEQKRRIGVYICHCGGNISDYVDVEAVKEAVGEDVDVVLAETSLFACSDGTQQDMIDAIREQGLDGLVVASCSPKLHLYTFRGVAARAGLNPFQYTQVNIREQDSWAHSDDPGAATKKAIALTKAGVAKTRLSQPLEPLVVETTPKTMVIGGGIAGLRAAVGLADIGLGVYLVEREHELGGWVARFGAMYPNDRNGRELIDELLAEVRKRPSIVVLTDAELTAKSGSFGNYVAEVHAAGEVLHLEVGTIIVATGFDTYRPEAGEFGYGIDGVLTLPEFKALVDRCEGPLMHNGKRVRTVAYVYCVGSRQPEGNTYCSRYCCAAAVHCSLGVATLDASVHQYHLYRDIRTYGKFELMYEESRERGSVYMKFPADEPPAVARAEDGQLTVTTRDTLTGGAEVTIPADLVVLVTGMVPRKNETLISALKLPLGGDGFFNEIHPKLRPVETVVDGVLIAGACQGPKSSSESVASGLTAVTQSGAILKRGVAELDPLVATVDPAACTWCGQCLEACPYAAIDKIACDGRDVATISAAMCKGCGACTPVCSESAIDLLGTTDAQIRAMIDELAAEPVA